MSIQPKNGIGNTRTTTTNEKWANALQCEPLIIVLSSDDVLSSRQTCRLARDVLSGYASRKYWWSATAVYLTLYPENLIVHSVTLSNFFNGLQNLLPGHKHSFDPKTITWQGAKRLWFSPVWNGPVPIVSQNVTHITFGERFNQRIDALKTTHVIDLCFGDAFDSPVNDVLPQTLLMIAFGASFNQPVNFLPAQLRSISFGLMFNRPTNNLPDSLLYIKYGESFSEEVIRLPTALTHLEFGASFNWPLPVLPKGITHLKFGTRFDQPVRDKYPGFLKVLEFGCAFNRPLGILPCSLLRLVMGCQFRQPIHRLPESLQHLQFFKRLRAPNYRDEIDEDDHYRSKSEA